MNMGFEIIPIAAFAVNVGLTGIVAYFIIRKAVKDGICEAMVQMKKNDESTKI